MKRLSVAAALLAAPALALAQSPSLTPPAGSPATPTAASDRVLIDSAMQAAPRSVGAAATIVAMSPDGRMRTLRQGSNGFTCMPDNPTTPGADPMCMDRAALDWVMAWMEKRVPATGRIGFMYMLQGGTDASNTDPYATQPTAGNQWIETGPHVMIVGADPAFYDMYPKAPRPDTASPYIMWAGTPYQHLMIPVR